MKNEGGSSSNSVEGKAKPAGGILQISIKDSAGDEVFLKVKKTIPMAKVFKVYAARKGISVDEMRFLLDGDRVNVDKTAEMLGLEDRDQIDCMLNKIGG